MQTMMFQHLSMQQKGQRAEEDVVAGSKRLAMVKIKVEATAKKAEVAAKKAEVAAKNAEVAAKKAEVAATGLRSWLDNDVRLSVPLSASEARRFLAAPFEIPSGDAEAATDTPPQVRLPMRGQMHSPSSAVPPKPKDMEHEFTVKLPGGTHPKRVSNREKRQHVVEQLRGLLATIKENEAEDEAKSMTFWEFDNKRGHWVLLENITKPQYAGIALSESQPIWYWNVRSILNWFDTSRPRVCKNIVLQLLDALN